MLEWKKINSFAAPFGRIKRMSIIATAKYNNATYAILSVDERFFVRIKTTYLIEHNINIHCKEKILWANNIPEDLFFDTLEGAKNICEKYIKVSVLR